MLTVLLVAACGGDNGDGAPTREEQAAAEAKSCYEALYAHQVATFLDGHLGADAMTADYREQLSANMGHYVRKVEQQRGGVTRVSVTRAEADESLALVQVLLQLHFADGTEEEIVVPMVQDARGQWKMK